MRVRRFSFISEHDLGGSLLEDDGVCNSGEKFVLYGFLYIIQEARKREKKRISEQTKLINLNNQP
jgi:hypothetical protein